MAFGESFGQYFRLCRFSTSVQAFDADEKTLLAHVYHPS
jgi:hypothetical protein